MGVFTDLLRSFLPSHDAFLFMWLLLAIGALSFSTAFERWYAIRRRTDYNAPELFGRIKGLLEQKRQDEAYSICLAGGKRLLPRIFACGIKKAQDNPRLVPDAMAEESIYAGTALEKRLNYMVMFGNVSTLFGLLGTVFGLIMSFTAVSRPEVAAAEKSALLAAGISTAMNSTLVGLSISVLSVLAYAFLRSKVDTALHEIDRYAVAIMNFLSPPDQSKTVTGSIVRRSEEEEIADADVTPMLNLMIILIPVLLTSSEFVRMGAIELKLPESAQGAGGGGEGAGGAEMQASKLELGILITSKGFTLFNYFKTAANQGKADTARSLAEMQPDIPLAADGTYNYEELSRQLAEVKRKALLEIDKTLSPTVSSNASLVELYDIFVKNGSPQTMVLGDHETIKIVAEEKMKYETVVAVMDAARGYKSPDGSVTMFPNVSIAGGIVQ
jgi:biopolymer transport protein ExbB/TolQ/biopolymer transport protein ExbD